MTGMTGKGKGEQTMEENKNKSTGWTEAEMAEGFIEQPQPERGKDTPDMSRKTELAGKTVRHNGYEYTYDELGYCVKCVKMQVG